MTHEIKRVIDPNKTLEGRIKIIGETEVAKAIGAEPMTPEESAEFLRKTQYNYTTKADNYAKPTTDKNEKPNNTIKEFNMTPYHLGDQPTIF
ncbi:hypothetical protein HZA97_09750 [Candidatus Woesearchaeota archaeon]|nr:hypothetical protein [Candidatus Woesearchaeota archaeon]